VNAVSLLARLELAGVPVGPRWEALAPYLLQRLHDHVLPFLDLHYLYGLARARRPEAHTLLRNIEAHAARAPERARAAWRQVCLPAARGVLAHAEGDFARAADELTTALPRLLEVGGSHAQRDLFGQMHLDALMRGGALADAQDILQRQLRGQPESLRLKRQAASLYAALGLQGKVPA
jgi:predicted NBD/HSP70 family sugar kinase